MTAGKTKTFDPFAMDRPTFRLGEHGEWRLADITKSNASTIDELIKQFNVMASDPNLEVSGVADVVGRLLEAACEDADGLHDQIMSLADEGAAKAGGWKPLGVIALRGAVEFILDWIYGEQTAGEG